MAGASKCASASSSLSSNTLKCVSEDPQQVVVDSFLEALNHAAGVHAVSVAGVTQFAKLISSINFPNPDPATPFSFGAGDMNTPEGVMYQRWPQGDLPALLAKDGPIISALGQQWIVMVAALWNDEYRGKFAEAHEVPEREVKDQIMADVTRLRNDVVHHRGIATEKNAGRCVDLRWFKKGEEIRVENRHIIEVMEHWRLTWRPGASQK